ncbi:MAG: hypothetical protein KKE02_03490 [Alphaproteobacteria bacterium]|nr:hypothetical protein [Alphaproteobacteria bacterium]MBU1517203.1 hypothetical protein [Alphaproteobacteria bacterium]MBU2093261.1 hypothetical protein [Alphaproteobacteria bacterium]MBU2150062.1 hypothetical protein [Alphaproteobacteria bacterium]MBU2307819.1 hypothetical protein [Alphaproteobacteria bacterium]
MSETDEELYLVLAMASAGPTTRYELGSRHTLLVFARAGSHEAALAVATAGMAERGWGEPAFQKAGIIELGPHLSAEDRAPAEHAMAHGCAVRVYERPTQAN